MKEEQKVRVDSNGLINPINQEHQENCILFSLEFLLLHRLKGCNCEECSKIEAALHHSIEFSHMPPLGYIAFPNAEHFMDEADLLASHDNLTAITSFSYMFEDDKDALKKVYSNLRDMFFRKPYLKNDILRYKFLHPRDSIYYSLLMGRVWAHLSFPLFSLFTLITFCRKSESSMLLALVRLQTVKHKLPFRLLGKVCTFILHLRGKTWYDVWKAYFTEEHEITKCASTLQDSQYF